LIADTSFLVDLLRGKPRARETLEEIEGSGATLWLPTPALFELWEGVERGDRPHEEAQKVRDVLAKYTMIPFGPDHAERSGRLSGDLARRGRMLDDLDAQIAGIALVEGQPVLTGNQKDFERVPGLKVVAY